MSNLPNPPSDNEVFELIEVFASRALRWSVTLLLWAIILFVLQVWWA